MTQQDISNAILFNEVTIPAGNKNSRLLLMVRHVLLSYLMKLYVCKLLTWNKFENIKKKVFKPAFTLILSLRQVSYVQLTKYI